MRSAKSLQRTMMSNHFLLFETVAVAAVFCVCAGCFRKTESESGKYPDLVLITSDGNVGFSPDGAFSYDGTLSPSPMPLPAAAAVLSGSRPCDNGVRINGVGSLSPDVSTIASELSSRGWKCAAFLSSIALGPRHGLTNGFEVYIAGDSGRHSIYTIPIAEARQLVDAALDFLNSKNRSGVPAFVWVHVSPFLGKEKTSTDDLEKIRLDTQKELSRLNSNGRKGFYASLYVADTNSVFQGLSLESCNTEMIYFGDGEAPDIPHTPINIKPALLRMAGFDPEDAPFTQELYAETLQPWYAFRLAPQKNTEGPWRLDAVTPEVLPLTTESMLLNAMGYPGDGLVSPYTNGVAVSSAYGNELLSEAQAALAAKGEHAEVLLSGLVEKYPQVPLFHEWFADFLFKHGKYAEAFNEYSKSADIGYNMIRSIRRQSECHMRLGNIPMAVDRAESAFMLSPDDMIIRRELFSLLLSVGRAMNGTKKYEAALECLNRAVWLEPKNAEACYQMAVAQCGIGATNSAVIYLSNALNLNPSHNPAKTLLGKISKSGKPVPPEPHNVKSE